MEEFSSNAAEAYDRVGYGLTGLLQKHQAVQQHSHCFLAVICYFLRCFLNIQIYTL